MAAAAAAVALTPESSFADEAGCWDEDPLLQVGWESLSIPEVPTVIGEWRLPVSSSRPEVMTEARVQMQLLSASKAGMSRVLFHFSFPDPKPYGIPFTFQKAVLLWASETGPMAASIDWSEACTGPGRGMYPRQSWSAVVDLPSLGSGAEIRNPSLRIWGSRN